VLGCCRFDCTLRPRLPLPLRTSTFLGPILSHPCLSPPPKSLTPRHFSTFR